MNLIVNNKRFLIKIFISFTVLLSFPIKIYAQCIDLTADSMGEIDAGDMISCILGRAWTFLVIVFVAVAIILTMLLVVKMIRARENPKELATIPQQWVYMILFWFLVAGMGGFFLNVVFKMLGYSSGLDPIFSSFNSILDSF